ncbi:hypothetical protein Btru_066450 [Bulinus truncatus]|nr:hypothetical protein Btru_066450 [Bulinus truncatus]
MFCSAIIKRQVAPGRHKYNDLQFHEHSTVPRMKWIVLFVFSWFPAIVHSYWLSSDPESIDFKSPGPLRLECKYSSASGTSFISVQRIRIDKQVNGIWSLIAELTDSNPQPTVISGATAQGSLATPDTTYLQVTWNVVTPDLLGVYRCELIGLNSINDFIVEKTPSVTIAETPISSATVSEIVKNETDAIRREFEAYKTHTNQELSDILNLIRENQISQLTLLEEIKGNTTSSLNELTLKYDQLTARVGALENSGCGCSSATVPPATTPTPVGLQWPTGTYGLYEPQTGCPQDTTSTKWTVGYRRHHTVSQQNRDEVSPGSHFAQPVLSTVGNDHYFFQRFCMVDTASTGPAWPIGSYCINRKGGTCPGGFNSGYIEIDDNGTEQDVVSGSLPDGVYNTVTRIYYCCRVDGHQDTPITLPTSKPFYLYRIGMACQKVNNMTATQEWFLIDTSNANNQDRFENVWHPDAALNDIRIQLCYYTPV